MWGVILIGLLVLTLITLLYIYLNIRREELNLLPDHAFIVERDIEEMDKVKIERWFLEHEL